MDPSNVNDSISSRFARELVFNWSGWISSQHDSPESAWDVECSNLSEEVVSKGHTVHVLRPAAWDTLWLRWLEDRENGRNITSVLKQEEAALSFKYVDRLEEEDNLVSKPEFAVAFNLAATELSIFPFCVFLHDRFWNSSQAWVATAGSEQALNKSRWSSLWAEYTPPFDFSKPSSSASFHYLDANANGLVSQPEFAWLFGRCHNTPTRSVSTTSAMSTKTTTLSTSGFTSTDSTTSWTRVTSTTTTSSAAVVNKVNQRCCNEVSAQCLSCIAGITIEELCSQDSMSLTPGCQGAPAVSAQAAPGGPHANAKVSTTSPPHFAEVSEDGSQPTECPFSGIAFSPILPGFKESQEEGLAGCQARCRQSMGCGFFTFWRSTRLCKLHPITAMSTPDSEAVAGPPRCVARFEAHISSVDFAQLSKPQINNLHASLPDVLAQHWKVPTSKVQDVEGHPGAVTLLQGSLLVEGKVLLPAGTAIADLVQKSDHGKNLQLRKKVSKLLLSSEIPFDVEGGTEDFEAEVPLSMVIEAKPGCFLEQTEYQSEEQEKVVADSVMDCQNKCATFEVCSVFTFFPENRQCYLTGESFSAASNEAALSGPAECPAVSLARMQGVDLPGQLVAGSKSTLEAVEQVPMVYLVLAGLVFLGLLVYGLVSCCRSKSKPKGKKAPKWHNQALYLPIAEEDEDATAREVRSRTPPAGSAVDSGAATTPPWSSSPKEAFSFHGPDVLSWRQP